MSRVHINFEEQKRDGDEMLFNVISPDFSESGIKREIIGQLKIGLKLNKFSFSPNDKIKSYFCPPEYFEKYGGDTELVDQVCKAENLMCTAWSYKIYRKVKAILAQRVRDLDL